MQKNENNKSAGLLEFLTAEDIFVKEVNNGNTPLYLNRLSKHEAQTCSKTHCGCDATRDNGPKL